MELKPFRIDRSKWLRGEGSLNSKLLRSTDEKMCCLGQLCLQEGLTPKQIMDMPAVPLLVKHLDQPLPETLQSLVQESDSFNLNSDIAWDLMLANDDPNINDVAREAELKDKFREIGFEVEFYN